MKDMMGDSSRIGCFLPINSFLNQATTTQVRLIIAIDF